MKYIFLPKNVQLFLGTPFDQSPIEEFEVDKENKYYCSLDGVIFSKDMKTLIAFPKYKNVTTYIVPNTVETIGTASMTRFVFLERIIIPDSVTLINPAFLYETFSKVKEVIIFRSYRQKNPIFAQSINSFRNSDFKENNIQYIFSAQVVNSCKILSRYSISHINLYVFILL